MLKKTNYLTTMTYCLLDRGRCFCIFFK